jgi:hypothetical protein
MVETQVGSHPSNPRAELTRKIKGVDAVIGSHESFLRQVFGFAALAQKAIADVEYARLIALHKLAERVTACGSATGTDDEVAV